MMTMIILSVLLAVLYVGAAIWALRGLPVSISSMVYVLPEGAARWLWSLWLIAVDVLTFAPLMDVLDGRGLAVVAFIPMALLAFVAAMPIFMEENKKAHDIMGVAAGVMSQVCVALICADWLFAWALFVFLAGSVYVQPSGWLGKAINKKTVFVVEAVCYISIIGCQVIN